MADQSLTEFLRARLDEDEAAARTASDGPWDYQDVESIGGGRICDPTVEIAQMEYDSPDEQTMPIRRHRPSKEADANGWHIVRHDPARVLRDVEAKRRIVELHEPDASQYLPGETMFCEYCRDMSDEYREEWTPEAWPCKTVRLLALVHSDHADWREGWRP